MIKDTSAQLIFKKGVYSNEPAAAKLVAKE